jgi:hypothetical protein
VAGDGVASVRRCAALLVAPAPLVVRAPPLVPDVDRGVAALEDDRVPVDPAASKKSSSKERESIW